MKICDTPSVPSKLVATRNGHKPLIERTDGEKIKICSSFLTKRGYVVTSGLLTKKELAAYLKCSEGHVANLLDTDAFPQPFDVGSKRGTIESNFKRYRWRMADILSWLESAQ